MSAVLLAIVVLSWGFSWYGITLQVGEASALISVTYRFILAATVMCVGLMITGRFRLIPWRDHIWLAALGACLFCFNFLGFYIAANYIPSGLLSVIFATASIFGALNQRLFLKVPLNPSVFIAAALGLGGLVLLLGPDINADGPAPWWAYVLPFAATYLFSLGNLISMRLSKSYSVPNVIGQGMVWGALILTTLCVLTNQPFVFPESQSYWAGVVFLALIASLLAFMTYLTLVNRIGPARAAYATVLFPIVAMMVSTWAEGYTWTPAAALGLAMALGGTVLTFARR